MSVEALQTLAAGLYALALVITGALGLGVALFGKR